MQHIKNFKKQRMDITIEKQLEEWVKGNPIHNTNRDECCPDFSCCRGAIADKDVRERFAKAIHENDDYTKMEMLGMFLGAAFEDEKIYVSTGNQGGTA
jgi:hypothetical protein